MPEDRGQGTWQRKRARAAAGSLVGAGAVENALGRAEAALHAADNAVGGVVPRQDYERLALDYSAWKVRAVQARTLLDRALETLDQIAGSGDDDAAKELRDAAFAATVELRSLIDVQLEDDGTVGNG